MMHAREKSDSAVVCAGQRMSFERAYCEPDQAKLGARRPSAWQSAGLRRERPANRFGRADRASRSHPRGEAPDRVEEGIRC